MSTSNPNPSDTSTSTDLEQDVPTQYRDVKPEFVEVGTAHMPANGFHAFHPLLNEPPSALSRDLKPLTSATLTVRIIKSFEYRTFKALVLLDLNLETMTVGELMGLVRDRELRGPPHFIPVERSRKSKGEIEELT